MKVKESPEIVPYREAFRALDINPNKFMCSIEALLTRIAKGKGFPEISPVVDFGNAVSLKYRLPIGAHDMGTVTARSRCATPSRATALSPSAAARPRSRSRARWSMSPTARSAPAAGPGGRAR